MARRRAEQRKRGERGGNARNRVGERERNECVPSRHSPPLPPSPSIISGYIPSSQGIKVRFPRRPEIMRPFAEGSGNETRILSRFVSLTRPRPSKHFYPSSPPPLHFICKRAGWPPRLPPPAKRHLKTEREGEQKEEMIPPFNFLLSRGSSHRFLLSRRGRERKKSLNLLANDACSSRDRTEWND